MIFVLSKIEAAFYFIVSLKFMFAQLTLSLFRFFQYSGDSLTKNKMTKENAAGMNCNLTWFVQLKTFPKKYAIITPVILRGSRMQFKAPRLLYVCKES